ncbi:MAG: BamA/TamA family outer membrane protein, partial [Verrucomicrobiaceae bacterium]|nr:BamA/TamA family outer membrane protein [Verrucomicrobiaceae bacterium]
ELWTAASFKRYWAAETRVSFPELAGRRVMAEAVASLREYPRESFFGLGPDSRRADLTTFSLRTPEVAGRAGLRLAPAFTAGGGLGVLSPRVNTGDTFIDGALQYTTDFVRSSGFFEVDYREPLNARRGGWYRLDISQFHDRDRGTWSFRRTDLDVRQYLGFLADRRVLALRGLVSSAEPANGSAGVPFYLMPTLGGHDTLRGFRNYRFRGPHALLLQAEYRWELWSGLDAALFYDAGKVAMRRSDLNFNRLQDDYGVGFRFNTATGVIMRVDAAFGSPDGRHLQIVFGGVF